MGRTLTSPEVRLEFREYVFLPEFPVLVLTPGQVSSERREEREKYHFHNCLEIGFGLEEESVLSFDGRDYQLKSGDFFVLSPFSMHYVKPSGKNTGSKGQYLYVDPESFLKEMYPFGLPEAMRWYQNSEEPFIFSSQEHPGIALLFRMFLEEYQKEGVRAAYLLKGLFQTIMIRLTRELSGFEADSGKYRDISRLLPALEAMHREYDSPCLGEDLAGRCGLSESAFRFLFRKRLGTSPGEYLRRIRLQKACELLYGTEKSVLAVSMETGFASLSSFYQGFQKQYHVSPKRWRDKSRMVQKKDVAYAPFVQKKER